MIYKPNLALLAILSALAFSVAARADTIIAYHPQDPNSLPFLHAAAGVASGYQSQVFSDLSENPFNHLVQAVEPGDQAAASLVLSFTDTSITSEGSSSGHYSTLGKGNANATAFADSQENFLLYITVTNQPVSFTLTASTSADGIGRSLISLSGSDVNVQYDTYSGAWPQSGTTTGILNPGTYTFSQADGTPTSNAPSAFGDSSSSAQLQISSVPEPSAWIMLVVGFGLVNCFSRRTHRHVLIFLRPPGATARRPIELPTT